MGIEPTYPAWKAAVLPLNYTRRCPVPGQIPEGYVQKQEFKDKPHFICTDFTFKAKLRNMYSEELKTPEGEPDTLEQEILNYLLEPVIEGKASLSFDGNANPSRNDFKFRLQERGFDRDQKTKKITYGLEKSL